MSASKLHSVPWQSAESQAQHSPQAAQVELDRSSDILQLRTLPLAQPQPPASTAWMEKLLQELSMDDVDGKHALVEVSVAD